MIADIVMCGAGQDLLIGLSSEDIRSRKQRSALANCHDTSVLTMTLYSSPAGYTLLSFPCYSHLNISVIKLSNSNSKMLLNFAWLSQDDLELRRNQNVLFGFIDF